MDDDPDLILMRGVAAGTPGAFETLRRRFDRYVRTIVRSRIADRAMAEDVVQEAMLSVWRTAAKFDPARGSLSTWIAVIVRRKVVDTLRHRARVARHGSPCLTESSATARLVDRWIDADEIRAMASAAVGSMSRLTPMERRSIELVYFRGMTFRQAWRELGLPPGTLKTHVRRGLGHLRMAIASPTYRPPRRPRPRQATPQPAPTSP